MTLQYLSSTPESLAETLLTLRDSGVTVNVVYMTGPLSGEYSMCIEVS